MTMTLEQWQARWGLPPQAIAEFIACMIPESRPHVERSEAWVQQRVRLEAAQKGLRLWRNNVGAGRLENGNFLRWGLANDSAGLNEIVKSGDLIGLKPVRITPVHVGSLIGQFVSRECKKVKWCYAATPDEEAQLRWAALINSMGGDAQIVNAEGSL